MISARSALTLAALGALFASGCTEQSFFVGDDDPLPGISPGEIMGRVCDPSGRTWLADAVAYTHVLSADGSRIIDSRYAYTDRDGYWYMDDLPAEREYTFYVQYGNEVLETHTMFLEDSQSVRLEEPDCFDPLALDVAIVTGDYDDFSLVLNNLGFANYQLIDGQDYTELTDFLQDETALSQFDMIFFNGGHIEEDVIYNEDDEVDGTATVSTVVLNLQNYVAGGGVVYGSDWAYDVIEAGWPDRIDWVGSDNTPNEAQVGDYDLVEAAVSDAALASWLDSNYIQVEYDLAVWPPIESVSGSVSTHIAGNVDYRLGTSVYTLSAVPLLVSFTDGEGKVVFSTFRLARNSSTEMMLVLQYMMYNL